VTGECQIGYDPIIMSPLTTHVLDVARGLPASGVRVTICRQRKDDWETLAEGVTDADGRCGELLKSGQLGRGVYRLRFETMPYFQAQKLRAFYPYVDVVFEVQDERRHHVPLLLSPFGYSTYRGS
jgi:5-hydroxyisourate hydrolase